MNGAGMEQKDSKLGDMKRADVVTQLECGCLPEFEKIAVSLRSRHPSFRINVGSGSVGGWTDFQGHHVYVECDREGSHDPEPNCVALEVCVKHLDREPPLCDLGVSWGGDGIAPCDTGDDLREEVVWNEDAIRLIHRVLPRLHDELDACLTAWEDAYPKP